MNKYEEEMLKLQQRNKKLLEALEEITEGKGAYSMNRLEHCSNTVRDMIKIAQEAIKETK